ncbi:helix-turn-helix domain-containing protein [Pseudomonas sp. WS 5059]|uniref:S24 family peptidase n=1 Tax=Pseudomonas sp. WS 5059 TaxID=2717491 RepID=UPI001475247F|nr:S24 family peptidase [Pseudomonas sp. WS 5059]NMY06364.1 helix-turn-helix domain-containing protein [Pseudomonas sp. WS 5059]
MEFKDRVTARMRALNLSATDISKLTGVSKATVSFWVSGTNGAKGKNLLSLARVLDCSPDWLSEGTGSPDTQSPAESHSSPTTAADIVAQMLSSKAGKGLPDEARSRLLAAVEEKSNVIAADFSRPGQVGDEVWIAHYDVRAAMGGGQIPHDYPEMLQDVRVSPKHLRDLGITFKEHFHLKMITGWGQSMAPTIKDRDPLLVDITIREFTGDGIYLFSHDEMLYVKRLQKKGRDRFKMISDNKHHDPEDIRVDDTHILARVLLVWNAHLV